ncbi:hypothetical protein PMAYCL1PPCAC_19658, partial [Pristionchus mayeri]
PSFSSSSSTIRTRGEGRSTTRKLVVHSSSPTSSGPPFAFSHSIYTASMPEEKSKNGALVHMKPENLQTNGKDGERLPFDINENTGQLAMFRAGREEAKGYDLVVKAFDRASNEVASAKIHVDIVEENIIPISRTAFI